MEYILLKYRFTRIIKLLNAINVIRTVFLKNCSVISRINIKKAFFGSL